LGHQRPINVLVVDDDAGIRTLLNAYLSLNGCHVVEKQDGREALEHIEKTGCSGRDVIVTDIVMPGMDGVALATWALLKCPGVKVVLMSGQADTESINLEAPDHQWMFVPKPFIPRVVVNAIHQLLDFPLV
jgi:two-component system, cell cycle sensor histidine kinase and response regulator CckA